MATSLPLPFTTQAYTGSQWLTVFQFLNSDGTLMDISGYTYQMVLRTSTENTGTPVIVVTSSAPGENGSIVISTVNSTVTVTLTPVATSMLVSGDSYALTLWQDPDLSDASVVVNGSMYVTPVAASV